MEENKILEDITKGITNKLKVPIIVTYVSVLIVFNWDILFFLFFEDIQASEKIKKIKIEYGDVYHERILLCLAISIGLILLFTILNTLINYCLKWFYRKDKEINSEIDNYEKVSSLTEQLSESIEKIKTLNSEISNLKIINDNLSIKRQNIDVSKISEKDYKSLIQHINQQSDKEKLLFSFKELMDFLKKNKNSKLKNVVRSATYDHAMQSLINILKEKKLVKIVNRLDTEYGAYSDYFELSKSFNDFFKIEN
jgi:hypothetical protein